MKHFDITGYCARKKKIKIQSALSQGKLYDALSYLYFFMDEELIMFFGSTLQAELNKLLRKTPFELFFCEILSGEIDFQLESGLWLDNKRRMEERFAEVKNVKDLSIFLIWIYKWFPDKTGLYWIVAYYRRKLK